MDIYNFIIGILLTILSILYFIYTIKRAKEDKNYRPIILSYDIGIVLGIVTFFVIGIIMVYREVKYFF